MRFAILLSCAGALFLGSFDDAFAQRGARTNLAWTQFQQRRVVDKKGFVWEVDANGGITSNTRAFSSSHYLTVNGSGMSAQSYQMTQDATQFRFQGQCGSFMYSRLVKIDLQLGTIRYLDTITNSQATNQTANVIVNVRGRTSSKGVKTAKGFISGRAYNGTIPEGEVGFACIPNSTSYKSALFYLCSKKSKIRPRLTNSSSSNYRFQAQYTVVIPAGKSITILHGASQQHWQSQPTDEQFAAAMKVFSSRNFTKDIPSDIRRRLINARASSGGAEFGPLLGPLDFLAESYDVERAAHGILVVGDESHVAGSVTGESIPVETRLGKTTIPVDQVAAIVGGGGVGRQERLLLRSGEVLAGTVDLTGIKFQATSGLTFSLNSKQIIALFTERSDRDGKAPAEKTPWVQTQFGDRLALRPNDESIIDGVSTWGSVSIPVAQVVSLHRSVSDDLPIHRLELRDGTQLWTILQGNSLKVTTGTLGDLTLAVAAIDRIGNVKPAAEEAEEETPAANPTPQPSQPSQPPASARSTGFGPRKAPASQSVPAKTQPPVVVNGPVPAGAAPGTTGQSVAPVEEKKAGAKEADSKADSDSVDAEDENENLPKHPTWILAGENRVVATLEGGEIQLTTSAGDATVKVDTVTSIEKVDEAHGKITFQLGLSDGSEIEGSIKTPTLAFNFHGQQWTVPVRHIHLFRWATAREELDSGEETVASSVAPSRTNNNLPVLSTFGSPKRFSRP